MREKSLFVPLWVRTAIYFCLGFIGMSIVDLLEILMFGTRFIGVFWHFLSGIAVSLFFLWEDSRGKYPSLDGEENEAD